MARPLMNKLSTEIIEQILDFEDVSIKDVINFKKTCKQFHNALMSNKFWHKKFVQRWPRLYEMYENQSFNKERVYNWFEEVKTCSKMKQKVANFVEEMPMTCFVQRFLSPDDIVELTRLWEGKKGLRVPLMMLDELVTMIDNKNVTLKQKYYGTLLLRYLRQHYLMEKWEKLPGDKRTPENMIIFVTEWFEFKELLLEPKIKSFLDDLADQLKECFKAHYPKHSLFEVSGETLKQWRTRELEDNQFNAVEARQVFDFLLQYFKELHFECKGLDKSYETPYTELQLFSITTAFNTKFGSFHPLYVTFMSVARRMGIRCDALEAEFSVDEDEFIYGFPILGWREEYGNNQEEDENYLIANFVMPNININTCRSRRRNMFYNLVHDISWAVFTQGSRELDMKFFPDPNSDKDYKYLLADGFSLNHDSYKLKCLDTHSEMDHEEYKNRKSAADLVQRVRNDKVKYIVGSILCHIPSRAYFVVTGWEMGESHVWYDTLRINKKGYGIDFLKQDENIILVLKETQVLASRAMKKEEIGRYFTHFDGTCFVPNEKFASIYPEDVQLARHYSFNPELSKALEEKNTKLEDENKTLRDKVEYLENKLQSESAAGDTNE